MTQTDVTLQLKFTSAVYVSQNEKPDKLKVTFRDPFMFISEKNRPLSSKRTFGRSSYRKLQEVSDVLDFITIERDLPPQLKLDGASAQVQNVFSAANEGSKALIITNFVINVAVSASLNQLWAMINTQ